MTSVWFQLHLIHICTHRNNLKPVTCCYQLLIHFDWWCHIYWIGCWIQNITNANSGMAHVCIFKYGTIIMPWNQLPGHGDVTDRDMGNKILHLFKNIPIPINDICTWWSLIIYMSTSWHVHIMICSIHNPMGEKMVDLPKFLVVIVLRPTSCRAPAPRMSWHDLELKSCSISINLVKMSIDTVGMSSTHWQYSATIFNRSNTVLNSKTTHSICHKWLRHY